MYHAKLNILQNKMHLYNCKVNVHCQLDLAASKCFNWDGFWTHRNFSHDKQQNNVICEEDVFTKSVVEINKNIAPNWKHAVESMAVTKRNVIIVGLTESLIIIRQLCNWRLYYPTKFWITCKC